MTLVQSLGKRRLAAASLAASFLLPGSVQSSTKRAPDASLPPGSTRILDEAFRFASAIQSDANDRSSAQERVVLETATVGNLDGAMRLADRIEGWERGVAYAEIAVLLVKERRLDEAREMIRKAEEFQSTVEGWQNPRIGAHVANALAALGAVDPSAAIVGGLVGSDRQYAGRGPATIAGAYAAAGNFEKAMAELAAFPRVTSPEDGIWRTQGYLEIARQQRFSRSRRLDALLRARRSAEEIPGWTKIESLVAVSGEYRVLRRKKEAKSVLERAEEEARTVPPTAPLCAPTLAAVAREWARLREPERARKLLASAQEIARATPDIGRPYIIANVAAGYHVLGDEAAARGLLDLAFSETRAQVNARPRAIAVVEICRTMARFGMAADDATQETLDGLYEGLRDPW